MNYFSSKTWGVAAVALSMLVLSTSATAAERYKDRQFKVKKTTDVSFATKVPHLSSYHTITESLLKYNQAASILKQDPTTVAYFYNNENDTEKRDLKLDLYEPKDDKAKDRALVIVSHCGAMVAGAKDDFEQKSVNYCDSLAARGYVAASIEYRLGVTLTGKDKQLSIDSVDFARAVYRGVQDVRAAVRYFRANADKYGINPERIYLLGNSAGAIISLEDVYARTEDDFPSYIKKKGAPDLGLLDDYGSEGNPFANGVVALWGAVHNLKMIGDNKTPVLLIHGTKDETVYFKTGRPLSNVAKVLQNLIPSELGATVASYALDLHAPTLYGSYVIDSLLTKKKIEHETYFVEGVAHEFYDDDPKYEKEVQKRAFEFLYKLTQSEPVVGIERKPIMLAQASAIRMGAGNMNFSVSRGKDLQYAVVDLRGRAAMSGNVSAGQMVDLSSLNSGVYVLRVQGERAIRFGLGK